MCHIGFGKQEVGTHIKSKEAQGKEAAHFRANERGTGAAELSRAGGSIGGVVEDLILYSSIQ